MFEDLLDWTGDVLEQLDPYNAGNQVLYYGWLTVYVFTGIAVWRSQRGWLRFLCFLVNQLFSVGMLLSTVLTVAFVYSFWKESLATALATAALALFLFRRKD